MGNNRKEIPRSSKISNEQRVAENFSIPKSSDFESLRKVFNVWYNVTSKNQCQSFMKILHTER